MKFKFIIFSVMILSLLSGPSISMATTSFKCGNFFVKEGIQSIAVLKSCGEPKVQEVLSNGGKSGKIEERWTYGPKAGYFYLLYFKGGVLEKVESVRQ